ncbi:hypothetical protein JTB14_016179 [Gonioctena quinquepunctata]|nr:hypothetical protein JTB14_016179 [Gonioctena quinquepunctata]
MAMSFDNQESVFPSNLTSEIGVEIRKTLTIHCDNEGVGDLCKNIGIQPKKKHIVIKHHFVREKSGEEQIALDNISTVEMVADPSTKALPFETVKLCTEKNP